jgi:hypothetical protein
VRHHDAADRVRTDDDPGYDAHADRHASDRDHDRPPRPRHSHTRPARAPGTANRPGRYSSCLVSTTQGTGTPVVTQVPGEPIITMETLEGEPIVTGPVCAIIAPDVAVTEEQLEPTVVESEAPGEPIVTTSVRATGESCYNNHSTAEQRRNRC